MKNQSWDLAVRLVALACIVVAAFWFVQKITWVLGLILVSWLLVYSISPLVIYLKKKGVPHFFSVLIVYFAVLLLALLVFYLIIPTLIVELRALARYLATDYSYLLPQIISGLEDVLSNDNLIDALQNISRDLPAILQQAVTTATSFTLSVFSGLTDFIIVLFLVFYLLRDLEPLGRGLLRMFPAGWNKEVNHIIKIIDAKVGSYLRGNVVRCGIVGLFTGTALALVGMPFALILGILAGVLNIIAYVGPFLAGIPAVILALTPDTPSVFLIIPLYLTVQAIDAFLLVPLLLGKAVDLRPFTIIVSLLIGGRVLGPLGLILSIPIAATLKVIIYHYYLKDDCKI